jgi:O-antigen ligase
MGVIYSASRAAWMNLALSVALYLGLRAWESRGRGLGRYWLMAAGMLLLVAGGSFAAVAMTDYGAFLSERTAMQDYDADRFAAQHEGIDLALEEPLGLGPGQFEPRVGVLGISAHSLYVRTLLENGVAGLVSLFVFLGLTLLVAFRSALSGGPLAACGAVVAASLVGVLFNSAVVDTLHWRSLWIQAGLAWGLYVVCLQQEAASHAPLAGRSVPGPIVPAAPLPPL